MSDPEAATADPPARRPRRLLRVVLPVLLSVPLLLGFAFLWRLSSGPISLHRFRPMIENRVSQTIAPLAVRLADASLVWRGWTAPLEIETRELTLLASDGVEIATLPTGRLFLSQPDLIRGRLVPLGLQLHDARDLATLRDWFDPSLDDALLGRLSSVTLRDATVVVEDLLLGRRWTLESVEASLERTDGGLQLHAAATVALDRPVGRLSADTTLKLSGQEFTLRIATEGLATDALARMDPRLELLRAVGARVSGWAEIQRRDGLDSPEVRGELSTEVGLVTARVEPTGEPGVSKVRLKFDDVRPWKIGEFERIPALAALRVPLRGTMAIEMLDLRPRSLLFQLHGGSGDVGPFPSLEGPIAIDGFELQGGLVEGLRRLERTDGTLDLGGLRLTFDTDAQEKEGAWTGRLRARLDRLAVERIARYWPAGLAADARKWVTERITAGQVRDARLELAGTFDQHADLKLDKLKGSFGFLDLVVAALPPQSPFREVAGRAFVNGDRLEFALRGARLDDLQVGAGSLALSRLDGEQPRLELELPLHGPLSPMLELLIGEPIALDLEGLPEPDAFHGTAAATVKLALPLSEEPDREPMELSGSAKIRDAALRYAPLGLQLDEANLSLTLLPRKLTLSGDLRAQGVPLQLSFEQRLDSSPGFRRLQLNGSVSEGQFVALGLPPQSILSGPVGVGFAYTENRDGSVTAGLDCDLTETALDLGLLDWSKQPGERGRLRLPAFTIDDERPIQIPIDLRAGDLSASGSIDIGTGPLELLGVSSARFDWAGNRLGGSLTRSGDGGWRLHIEGERLDVGPFLATGKAVQSRSGAWPPFELSLKLARLGAGDRWLEDVSGNARWDGRFWTELRARTGGESDDAFRLSFLPDETGHRLEADCENLGALLKTLQVTESLEGGRLQIRGTRASATSPVDGYAELDDTRLKELHWGASLLRLASLEGALRSLEGGGLNVQKIQTDFSLVDARVELEQGRVYADGIGVAADGEIDLVRRSIELHGSVAPAATLQRVLGKLPLLGPVLTGTKGGGLVASRFEVNGPLSDPAIDVQSSSLLTPGILRELFEPRSDR